MNQRFSERPHGNNAIFCTLKAGFNVLLLYYQVSCYQVSAELSSAQYFTAALAPKSRAVRCRAVLCRASCCAVLIISFPPRLVGRNIIQQYRGTPHQVCTLSIVLFREILSGHLTSAIAQQRAAQRRAVRCIAVHCLRCGGEPCCAVLSFSSYTRHQVSREVPGTRYRYVRVYSSFSFLHLLSSPSVHLAFFFLAFLHITPALLITQHSTGQLPPHKYILALSNKYLVAPNHGSYLFAQLTCPLREETGARQPPPDHRSEPL